MLQFDLRRRLLSAILLATVFLYASSYAYARDVSEYVIQISVDGGGSSYVQRLIDENQLPNFKRFQMEGAWTNNARTDYDFTVTLPNHACMITGRPVYDKLRREEARPGHIWTINGDPGTLNLHTNAKSYVKSTFDMVHDSGLTTAMFASKPKISVYDQLYDQTNGAPDTVGDDNGRDKIDICLIHENPSLMTRSFLLRMNEDPINYSFVHFRNADFAGHAHGWGSVEYRNALKEVNDYLGLIFGLVTTSPKLNGRTAIVMTADHGGFEKDHFENDDPLNYTIIFYVWGAGVAKGTDLYKLNPTTRAEPGRKRIDYPTEKQPIRNGDAGNLALWLIGLPPIPESLINAKQDLATDNAERNETAGDKR